VHQNGGGKLVARGRNYSDSSLDQDQGYVQEPIISESTPFFHVDLVAAVRVAEKLGIKEEEEESEGGPSSGGFQEEILIDLHN